MSRRLYRPVFAGLLLGLSLSGLACGGKEADQPSNAPVGQPPAGQSGPVQATGAMGGDGATKLPDGGTAAPRR